MATGQTQRSGTARGAARVLTVPGPDGPIGVTVTRKRVKNLNLRVGRDGQVSLSVPRATPDAAVRDFLERRAGWIAVHVARQRARSRTDARTAQGPHGAIPLWGRLVPTAEALAATGLLPASLPPRTRTFGSFTAQRGHGAAPVAPADPAAALADRAPEELDRLVQELYRREVARVLPGVSERVERRMGVRAATWQVRRMTSRWGSCTPGRRSIRISTALAAYPPACLEMVVTHELVHLMEPSHNARFHALLDRFCPENRELGRLLRKPAREVAENPGA